MTVRSFLTLEKSSLHPSKRQPLCEGALGPLAPEPSSMVWVEMTSPVTWSTNLTVHTFWNDAEMEWSPLTFSKV